MLIRTASLNRHLQNTIHLYHLLPLAALASVLLLHDLPLTSAVSALALRLRVHAGTQLDQSSNHSSSLALGAFSDVIASLALAGLADTVSSDLHVFHGAVVDLLQSDLQLHQLGLTLTWTSLLSSTTSSSEHLEQVAKASSSGSTTILNSLLSVVIIELSLLGIGEDFVCASDFLELIRVSALIGVLLQGFLPESLADLLSSGLLVDAQQLIVLIGINLFCLCRGLCLLSAEAEVAEPSEPSTKHAEIRTNIMGVEMRG